MVLNRVFLIPTDEMDGWLISHPTLIYELSRNVADQGALRGLMRIFFRLSIIGVVGLNPTWDIGVSLLFFSVLSCVGSGVLMGGFTVQSALPVVSNESVSIVLDWNRLRA
jgi:hypothetical protein